MLHDAPNRNYLWAGLLIEELVRGGCRYFVVAPGSRSTPLALAAAGHPAASTVVHFDERGAAFHALGNARATGAPAAVICTSGSAVANLWPAVVEADAAQTPLVLLTADRPPELLHTGANQAIDQERIFGTHVRWACTLPCPDDATPPQFVLTTAALALRRAQGRPAGPVHLNCPFREPLAPLADGVEPHAYLDPVRDWVSSNLPYTATAARSTEAPAVPDAFCLPAHGLLIAGALHTAQDREAVCAIARRLGWPLFADIGSGLRIGPECPTAVPAYDQLLMSPQFIEAFQPECVLHLGGRFTSKRLQQFLERLAGQRGGALDYVHVAPHALRLDPGYLVRRRVDAELAHFAASCRESGAASSGTGPCAALRAASGQVEAWLDRWLAAQQDISEIALARMLSRLRPAGSLLFLGNSMPVRDMDMYAAGDGPPGPVFANRGASGIDGNIATATGIAAAGVLPVTAILGDLAVLHDLNSLALLREIGSPFVLLIVNNDGGGIFSFLPVAQTTPHFEACFGTPHGCHFRAAAEMFGIAYCAPGTLEALRTEYLRALQQDRPQIIEVRTNRQENVRLHQEVQAALAALLGGFRLG